MEEHGQEKFYFVKHPTGGDLDVLEHFHNFTLDMIAQNYKERINVIYGTERSFINCN